MRGNQFVFLLVFLASGFVGRAAPCTNGTLDAYIGLGNAGCNVGSFAFAGFNFNVESSTGGAIPVSPADIMVTPFISGDQTGLTYSSAGFSVATGQRVQYLLSYFVGDPPIIHGFAVSLRTDPPVFPGIASITSDECLGANFSGSSCADTIASQTVFSNGVTSTLDAEEFFPPVNLIGNRTTITLDATSGGSAEFMSLSESVVTLPEPLPVLSALLGLIFLVARSRWRSP